MKSLEGMLQEGGQIKGIFSREGLYDMPSLRKAYSWDFEFDETLPAPSSRQ